MPPVEQKLSSDIRTLGMALKMANMNGSGRELIGLRACMRENSTIINSSGPVADSIDKELLNMLAEPTADQVRRDTIRGPER